MVLETSIVSALYLTDNYYIVGGKEYSTTIASFKQSIWIV